MFTAPAIIGGGALTLGVLTGLIPLFLAALSTIVAAIALFSEMSCGASLRDSDRFDLASLAQTSTR